MRCAPGRTWFIEPFAGTFALTRALLGGVDHLARPRIPAPVAYMGAKNLLAAPILRLLGLCPGDGADRVALNDGSTIGRILPTLLHHQEHKRVGAILRGWEGEDPRGLWFRLRDEGPSEDPAYYAASWLWLQARAASGVPVWWSNSGLVKQHRKGEGEERAYERANLAKWDRTRAGNIGPANQSHAADPRLVMDNGARDACAKGVNAAGAGGILSTVTLARRLSALWLGVAMDMPNCDLSHQEVTAFSRDILPSIAKATRAGWRVVVYLDPPYQGATGYELGCSREAVLSMALDYDRAGAIVAVSEAVALDLPGWQAVNLPARKPEVLTTNRPVRAQAAAGSLFAPLTRSLTSEIQDD